MKQICCDRCGDKAEDENNLTVKEPHWCKSSDGHRFVIVRYYDLCDNCLAEIIKWIKDGVG